MQPFLLKLQADLEARKHQQWDVRATVRSAILGIALAVTAFLLGIRAADAGARSGTMIRSAPGATTGVLDLQPAQIERLKRISENSSRYGIPADLAERIEDTATAEGIAPSLAFGLVATESEFDRHAVSPVGGVGYTQLMPSTARYFRPELQHEEMFDADTNLRLGFRYLRTLIDKYHGDVALALTAYNRGTDRVDALLRNGENPDNGYARLVLRESSRAR